MHTCTVILIYSLKRLKLYFNHCSKYPNGKIRFFFLAFFSNIAYKHYEKRNQA